MFAVLKQKIVTLTPFDLRFRLGVFFYYLTYFLFLRMLKLWQEKKNRAQIRLRKIMHSLVHKISTILIWADSV